MPLHIDHYWPVGTDNIGDKLVAQAIQQALRQRLGAVEIRDVPVNDRCGVPAAEAGLRGRNLENSNQQADLVIVGGSNLLEPRKISRGNEHSLAPWGVLTDVASIERLRPPLLLIGMGTGSGFRKAIRRYTSRAAAEVQALFAKAAAASVRDLPTVRELRRIGVAVECTGCPVTFLTNRPIVPQPATDPLLVSFPPSRIVKRWGGRRFMRQAMNYVRWLVAQHVPVVLTLHEDRDREIVAQWAPFGVEVFHTHDLSALLARYEQSRGVIGFRLHAALLALGLGKPIVPVGVDWRGQGMIDTFGLRDLSITTAWLGQFSKLRQLTERLLANDAELLSRLREQKQHFQERHAAFLDRALSRCLQTQRSAA